MMSTTDVPSHLELMELTAAALCLSRLVELSCFRGFCLSILCFMRGFRLYSNQPWGESAGDISITKSMDPACSHATGRSAAAAR